MIPPPPPLACSRRSFLRTCAAGAAGALVLKPLLRAAQDDRYQDFYEELVGPIIPITPAFDEQGGLDLASTERWVSWLQSSGIRLFWTTYGTSHYQYLSDSEILQLNERLASLLRGRAHFIASSNFHWSVDQAVEFVGKMENAGASAVKVELDWSKRPTDDAVFDYYQAIAQKTNLPLLAYTHAYPPAVKGMSLALEDRLLGLPQYVGMKNDSGDFYEQCAYLREVRLRGARWSVITGGTMSSFLHGYDFGQRAFATGVGIVFPKVALRFYRDVLAGRRREAIQLIEDIEEPFNALPDRLSTTHWAGYHAMLRALGYFKSDHMRTPLATTTSKDKDEVRALMESPMWRRAKEIEAGG